MEVNKKVLMSIATHQTKEVVEIAQQTLEKLEKIQGPNWYWEHEDDIGEFMGDACYELGYETLDFYESVKTLIRQYSTYVGLMCEIQEAQDKIDGVVSYIVHYELDEDSRYRDISMKLTDARNALVEILGEHY